MNIKIDKCGMAPGTGELSLSIEIQGQAGELKDKLPPEILELILSKMWCKSWFELEEKIKTWIETK